MSARYLPRTLAKILTYIAWHSPSEFGLFWDPDGTMPWKELHWALQEDPELRFVREAHIRELALLGVEIPFLLDGAKLRLRSGFAVPVYTAAGCVPERLYHAVRRSSIFDRKINGLISAARSFLPLFTDRGFALKVAGRRHEEPVMVEVMARAALASGVSFLGAGPELFLVSGVPADFLILPVLRQDHVEQPVEKPRKKQKTVRALTPVSAGSFVVEPGHLFDAAGAGKPEKAAGKQPRKSGDWKKERRKERRKRNI